MKSTPKAFWRVIMFAFFAAVLVYFGEAVYSSWQDDVRTLTAYESTIEDSIELTGFVVREETVIPLTQAGTVDVLLSEGEKVARGGTVANLYQNSASIEQKSQITRLEQELEQLEDTRSRNIDTGDTLRLGDSIISAITDLRGSVARGDLTALETQASTLKNLVFKRSYTYEGTDTNLDETITDLARELDALRAEYSRSTQSVLADVPGIYSGFVDGYESLLSPLTLETVTPAELDDLLRHPPDVTQSSVGKLVTNATWYFTFSCSTQQATRFTVGNKLTVRFSRDVTQEFRMKVSSISEEQNGRVVISLSSNQFIAQTTLLRQQSVELIFGSKTGLYVPKSALRTDEEGNPGIYTIVGIQAEYKPVTIVAEGADYFLVTAADSTRKALRQGEEVIISGLELFDGKVVRG